MLASDYLLQYQVEAVFCRNAPTIASLLVSLMPLVVHSYRANLKGLVSLLERMSKVLFFVFEPLGFQLCIGEEENHIH